MNKVADMIRSTSYWSKLQVCFYNLHKFSIWLPRDHFRVIISLNRVLTVTHPVLSPHLFLSLEHDWKGVHWSTLTFQMFFTPHHLGHCCIVIRDHCWVTVLYCPQVTVAQHCARTMTSVPSVARFPAMVPPFALLRNNCPGNAICLPPRKNATDRQTWMGP
jgi:hypothetical protein